MKKLLSIIMVLITVFTIFTSTASAESAATDLTESENMSEETNESEEKTQVIDLGYYYELEDNNLFVIMFRKEYKTFADDFTLTISEKKDSEGNMITYKKSDVISLTEHDPKQNGSPEVLAVYIILDNADYSNMNYVSLSANAVFDESGKGNKESTSKIFEICPITITNKEQALKYTKGDEVTYSMNFVADFYVNGELVGNNIESYTLKIAKKGSYKVTIKKYDKVVFEETFDTATAKKEAKAELDDALKTLVFEYAPEGLLIFLISPFLAVFPPFAAGLLVPFIGVGMVFKLTSEYIKLIGR